MINQQFFAKLQEAQLINSFPIKTFSLFLTFVFLHQL